MPHKPQLKRQQLSYRLVCKARSHQVQLDSFKMIVLVDATSKKGFNIMCTVITASYFFIHA